MRLLLIEDNEELSRSIASGLERAGFDTDVVATAEAALGAFATVRFAAAILDLGLPDQDGLSVLRSLRGRRDPTPILVLTARSGIQDRVAGLQGGADDYVVKPFALEELVARLHALLRRPGQVLGSALEVGNVAFDTVARQVTVANAFVPFSPREATVLELLMRRNGRVVPKALIEDQLSGLSGDVGSNAVEVYVHRVRRQLAEAGATARIHTVHGVGYLVIEAVPPR